MIVSLFLALQAHKLDFEVVQPISDGVISVEVLMRLPKAGPRERAELAVLSRALLDNTQDFNHHQLLRLTSPSGEPVRCDLLPDALRVRFGVAESDASTAISILSNIVHSSALSDESLKQATEELQFVRKDYWSSGLNPEELPLRKVEYSDIHALYQSIGRVENLVVTVAADPAVAEKLADKWKAETDGRDGDPPRLFAADQTLPRPMIERRGKLTTIVLRGRPLNPKAANIYTQLLATFALGGGKSSAVWKALREGLGWSYRQEAILRNSPEGLEPVIEVVTGRSDADFDHASAVLPALEKAVAAWTDADRIHALGTAHALLERGIGLDPLYFKGTVPASGDPLFMRTYWRMKSGHDWETPIVLGVMDEVSLADLQAAAKAMLDGMSVEVIRGSG